MIRRLKHAVGTCCVCGSSSVFSQSNKYADKKKYWSVICCNPECGKKTPGYASQNEALAFWDNTWGK